MRTIQKRLLVSLTALLALSMGASAQKGSDSREAIDSVMYRITYKTQSVKDTTKLDEHHHYIYGNDEMRLDIGRHQPARAQPGGERQG